MKGKKIILCIICLVAILSIIIAFGVSQKDNAKDKTNEKNQNNMQIELQEGIASYRLHISKKAAKLM